MKIADYLDKDEVRYFTARSNWQALWVVVVTWSSLLAVLWIVDTWTNPLTILLAIMLLAGRQLGLAVITHDCGHNTLFEYRGLNHFVGQWFAAHPTFADMPKYASGHTNHHKLAGTREDPDLPNYQAYPVDRASFKRKMIRDMTGQTGIKLLRYVFSQARGAFSPDPELRLRARPFVRQIAVNSVLATVLALLFSPWVYILWLVSFLTTYMVIVRIRQVAEHAAVPDLYHPDPRLNTRTTVPSWWERMFFAPNFVNYHLEHHFMASVPCYKLKALHQLLKDRGAYGDTRIFHGYREVLQHTVA